MNPYLLRVGHLYPSGGISDHEVQSMAPAGVRFHTTRLSFKKTGIEDDKNLFNHLEESAELLADAAVDLIVVNCTAATMLAGPENVNARVLAATGIRSTTTIEAVISAIRAASLQRVALLTPYPPDVVEAEVRFFDSVGVEVVVTGGQPCSSPVQQGLLPPEDWFDMGVRLSDAYVDGLLISCSGAHVSPVLDRLERHWDRPVISSNQALVWHALNCMGVSRPVSGFGALLERRFDALDVDA